MESFTAVPSHERKGLNGVVLIDISRLSYCYGVSHDRPVLVAKTTLHGDFSDGWCFYIEEHGGRSIILKSADAAASPATENVDLISLLGHGLILMPQQKLIFVCPHSCSGITYVDLQVTGTL